MNLGAEPKKVAILGVLVVVALGGLYFNSSGGGTPPPATRTPVPVASTTASVTTRATKTQTSGQSNGGEFRLRVLGSRPDDKIDPKDIDPELKLDLLAKVQAVEPIEAGRNLFQYGAAPPPPGPVKPLPTNVPPIPIKPTVAPPPPPTITQVGPPPTPPPPPINLKYYGYVVSKVDGRKEAFLLDGEDILFATENQTVKQRYKIVRIALTSIVIEDTLAKNTQTLQFQDLPSS